MEKLKYQYSMYQRPKPIINKYIYIHLDLIGVWRMFNELCLLPQDWFH